MPSLKFFPHFVSQYILGICILIFISGCSVSQVQNPDSNPEEILADCFIYFYLASWEDENQNGLWDENEGPLEGVEFFVDGKYASSGKQGKATSEADGRATIDTWSPGECLDHQFTIRAEPPDGYSLTTESPLFHEPGSQSTANYQFGFFHP